jgi:hypothetical protein
MRHAAIAASLGFIFSASASATLIESYMDTRTSLALQVPKTTVVIKETGGTGTISADAKTLNNGSQNNKFSLDKKGGNIHEIRKADGTVFIKDLDSDYLSTTAEKGSEKGEYAKGFGSQITGERNRKVAGKEIHEWTVDLATSAKAQADTTLKNSSASAKGTSEDPWMFFSEDFASISDDFLLLDFDLVAGTGFGASAGGASSGMLYLDTTIPGLEHLMRVEMGSPRPGSSSPWFHVTSNPLLGLDDAALGAALAAAFQLDRFFLLDAGFERVAGIDGAAHGASRQFRFQLRNRV